MWWVVRGHGGYTAVELNRFAQDVVSTVESIARILWSGGRFEARRAMRQFGLKDLALDGHPVLIHGGL